MKKTFRNRPSLRVNKKAGLVSLNTTATANLFANDRSFIFVNIPEDKTTYIVPFKGGFEFRFLEKKEKGHNPILLHNNSFLVRDILAFNNIEAESFAFSLGQAKVDIKIEEHFFIGYPLIKVGI